MSLQYFKDWKRFMKYELKEHKEKGLYIVPADCKQVTYKPMNFFPKILLSLLDIGYRASKNQNTNENILSFCNRFGLLGFGQAIIVKEYADSTIKLFHDNVLGMKAIHETAFMDIFFPFESHSHRVIKGHEMPMTDRWDMGIITESVIKTWPIFNSEYAEQVRWIEMYALKIYNTMKAFRNNEPFTLEAVRVKQKIRCDGNKAEFILYADSLKSLLDYQLIQDLKQPQKSFRLCKRCLKPFYASGTRAEYCSASCRNVMNVKASRQKKKLDKQI